MAGEVFLEDSVSSSDNDNLNLGYIIFIIYFDCYLLQTKHNRIKKKECHVHLKKLEKISLFFSSGEWIYSIERYCPRTRFFYVYCRQCTISRLILEIVQSDFSCMDNLCLYSHKVWLERQIFVELGILLMKVIYSFKLHDFLINHDENLLFKNHRKQSCPNSDSLESTNADHVSGENLLAAWQSLYLTLEIIQEQMFQMLLIILKYQHSNNKTILKQNFNVLFPCCLPLSICRCYLPLSIFFLIISLYLWRRKKKR